jgi:hypothetical protein
MLPSPPARHNSFLLSRCWGKSSQQYYYSEGELTTSRRYAIHTASCSASVFTCVKPRIIRAATECILSRCSTQTRRNKAHSAVGPRSTQLNRQAKGSELLYEREEKLETAPTRVEGKKKICKIKPYKI